MPIYQYKLKEGEKGCDFCRNGFEVKQSMKDEPLKFCPKCGSAVVKVLTEFSIGQSKSGFNRQAFEKGFSKFKKVDKGKYEKLY